MLQVTNIKTYKMIKTKLIQFHTIKCHPLFKKENKQVATKLICKTIIDYDHYLEVCKIYKVAPYYKSVFTNHLKGI